MWKKKAADKTAPESERRPVAGTTACPSSGEDAICSDEVEHTEHPRDSSELDGSILEVGAGMAGLMPVELPENTEQARRRGTGESSDNDGCGKCR